MFLPEKKSMWKNPIEKHEFTLKLKNKILLAGFTAVGIAPPKFLEEQARYLEKWLAEGKHGTMRFMENHFDLRVNPKKLFPETRSVLVALANYYTPKKIPEKKPQISRYAYGMDYHFVLKNRLRKVFQTLETSYGNFAYRIFTDSAPIMEKVWAQKAGLGWISKNTNLITRKKGSYHFIATVLMDIETEFDKPLEKDFCGNCNRCIDACPTKALSPFRLDATRCISYQTIETKEFVSEDFPLQGWAFGCDICQEVCPWNRFSKQTDIQEFTPLSEILDFSIEDWEKLSGNQYKKLPSPITRVRKQKFIDNLKKARKSLLWHV